MPIRFRARARGRKAVVNAIGVDSTDTSLEVGQTSTCTALAFQNTPLGSRPISGVTVVWSSSNAGIASVNSSTGVVTGVAEGLCTIYATATNGVVGSVEYSITAASPVLTTITVGVIDVIVVGTTVQADAIGYDQNGIAMNGVVFTWSTSNAAVATVNSSTGVVTPVAAGTCNIIATNGSVSDSEDVTVNTPTPTLSSMVVSPDNAVIVTSGTQQYAAVGTYSDGSVAAIPATDVTWSETGGGSINSAGLYTAGASPESVVITGTVGIRSDTANATVAAAGAFPASLDPARLGSDLLNGTNWPTVTIGQAIGGVNPGQGFSAYGSVVPAGLSPQNLTATQVECVADSLFGKVMRVRYPGPVKQAAGMPNYAQLGGGGLASPVSSWWYSAIMKFDGNGCLNGAAPTGGYPTANYPTGGYFTSYGTGVAVGSTTMKLMFGFPVGLSGRTAAEIFNGGYLNLQLPQFGGTATRWTTKGSGGVNDVLVASGGSSFPYANSDSLATWRADGEYYQIVERWKRIDATTHYYGIFWRKLTTGAGTVLSPGGWRMNGWNLTGCTSSPTWSVFQPLGNKSQSNDGPNDMFVSIPVWEVVADGTTAEPYATLNGFGNHL